MKRSVFIILWILMCIVAVFAAGYFYLKYQSAQKKSSSTSQEVQEVLAAVAKLMVLPERETPTIASVTDIDKLKNQPFFVSAQNGDKVIIYAEAKRAILYRPSLGKIIDVTALTFESQATTSAQTQKEGPIRFVLYNGTNVTGLTRTYEKELKQKILGATVVDRDNASKRDYEKSVLIDLTGNQSAQATQLGAALGIEIGTLPEGETKPENADFLIILGVDK